MIVPAVIPVATRTLVNLSTLSAAALLAWYGGQGYAPLDALALATFLTGLVAGRLAPAVTTQAILFVVYLSPAAFLLWSGRNHFSFEIAWMAALLGLMLSGRGAWTWSLPTPWRWAIAWWALVISVTWPIVAGREYDFAWWIGELPRVSNTSIGIAPAVAATWVVYVVVTHNVGLMWIDWLYERYATDLGRFRREVAWPLATAILISSIVGLYQGLVDIRFLSGHLWPHMERAAGTLMDANAFGMLAAMWAPALVALTTGLGGVRAAAAGAALFGLAVTGVWTSGSRTALVAVACGLVAAASYGWRAWRAAEPDAPLVSRRNAVVAGGVLVVAAGVVTVMLQTPGITAWERARHLVPGIEASAGESLWLLWDRMGYGSAAVLMIGEHAWAGVGVGGYHTLVHDYAAAAGGYDLPPDNAQNWFRHQLAELGVLGSLPWIAWVALFLAALFRRGPMGAGDADARLVRGALVGVGFVSLVGMPGQAPAVMLTFWAFAFWFLRASGRDESSCGLARPTLVWGLIALTLAAHVAATTAVATSDLRPAERAARFGWYYRYGIYDLETPAGAAAYRWTMREAVAVIPVEGAVLAFEARVDHPDADETPVAVKVWADDRLVAEASLRRGERVTATIPARPGRHHMILRTEVDRAFRPIDHGGTDPRELGLAISDWRWQ